MKVEPTEYPNMFYLDGRPAYRIAYLTAGKDEKGKTGYVDLWSPPLKYAALRLFPAQRFMLQSVGIDPDIKLGEEFHYADFFAIFKLNSDKTTKEGNPYKDVVELMPVKQAQNTAVDLLTEIADSLVLTNDKLDRLAEILEHYNGNVTNITAPPEVKKNGTSPGQIAAAPKPKQLETEKDYLVPTYTNEKEKLVKMVGNTNYHNCLAVMVKEPDNNKESKPREVFLTEVKKRLAPKVSVEAIDTFCKKLDPEWGPELMWKPMLFAIAFYLEQPRETEELRAKALQAALAIYIALMPEKSGT